MKLLFISLPLLFTGIIMPGQGKYHNADELNRTLNRLSNQYPEISTLKVIGKTFSGQDIIAISIGTVNIDDKPGIAIIGGIDGQYLLSREIALGIAEKLLDNSNNDEIKSLLDELSFYIIPDASPDASAAFFEDPLRERLVNGNPTDNDRDFRIDEDPCEDLNGDGYITVMRIKDPTGDYIKDPKDNRLMRKAETGKGETGKWFVYSEGTDNDKDGKYNEDGKGGVNFNNNFSFEYEEFGKNAGINAVSEKETRAVADFLYDHYNIFAVFSFGPQDNLGQPFKAGRQTQQEGRRSSRLIKSILPEDGVLNKLLSEKYIETTAYKGSPGFTREPGNFMEWAYFHYGRYSYSTPGWWIKTDKGLSKESSFLKYAADSINETVFIGWQQVDHPDFPGKVVEVGGIKPFVMYNPPEEMLDDIITKNYNFLIEAACLHPQVELLDLKTEKLEKNLYRVSVTLHNSGIFSTMSQHGERNKWMRKMKVEISSSSDFEILSGKRIEITDRLKGDESRKYSWLIIGKGDFSISAGAVNCGIDKITFSLR